MVKLVIDGRELEAREGATVLETALAAGIDIPRFCHHPAFEPEGTCRMCLIAVEGAAKLELACSTKVREGMKVQTGSPEVRAARREVLELLLAEHPLDCPICDKAGDCRLQDYYERYGRFPGRFREARERRDKIVPIGRSLLLDNERCILCTRCVRFLRTVTRTGELGVYQRGVRTWIGLYEGRRIDNDYSGNLAEICPVGAITDADFRARTRTWLLERGETICPHCGRGCSIFVEFLPGSGRGGEPVRIFRVRARENPDVNGHWICDVGRYAYPRWLESRSARPVQHKDRGETELSWDKAFNMLSEKILGLAAARRAGRIGLVLESSMTNEALALVRGNFQASISAGSYWFADPAPGRADGLLLTAERTPNVRGARELGFEIRPPDLAEIAAKSDLLCVFGTALVELFPEGRVREAFAGIPAKFLFAARTGALDLMVDVSLPTAVLAESSGSMTNVDGRIQGFRALWAPPGEARPVAEILTNLGRALGAGQEGPE
jgi:NADH-quinone oxidoreductase subunit G